MPTPGPLELVIILVIALLILGPGRLPDVGSALGKSLREFRKASSDIQDAVKVDTSPLPPDETTAAQAPATAPAAAAAPVVAAVAGPGRHRRTGRGPGCDSGAGRDSRDRSDGSRARGTRPERAVRTPTEEVAAAPASAGPADSSGSENAS